MKVGELVAEFKYDGPYGKTREVGRRSAAEAPAAAETQGGGLMGRQCSCYVEDVTSFGSADREYLPVRDPACSLHGDQNPVDEMRDRLEVLEDLRDPDTGLLRFADRTPSFCSECGSAVSNVGIGPHLAGCPTLGNQKPRRLR